MVFSSIVFLLYFLPLFFLCYYATPKKYRNWTLLSFSIVFYAWGAPFFIYILLLSTIIDFYLVRWMHNTAPSQRKKLLLGLSIFLNLGLLAYFKYANFFVENIQALFNNANLQRFEWTEVILPIGISFYTFQTLTYSIDVYQKRCEPLKEVKDYVLYILMFPQLIAGPIVRFNAIATELVDRTAGYEKRLIGLYRFSVGLAKKVIIANPLGAFVDDSLANGIGVMDSSLSWLVITAYALQIFFDFSGYSDMAIGLGRMTGFTFPENFERPYRSGSITEFWRRWHITLSNWMRDYLYIPLGGSKVNSASRLYINLGTVFVLSGLWHGASWNFVLWGAFHGVFLILDRLFLKKLLNKTPRLIAVAITFVITLHGWVIFRIEDSSLAFDYYARMYSFQWEGPNLSNQHQFIFTLFLGLLIAFLPKRNWLIEQLPVRRHFVDLLLSAILIIISISMISSSNFNPFIYFRF